jgi:hypothetical protein
MNDAAIYTTSLVARVPRLGRQNFLLTLAILRTRHNIDIRTEVISSGWFTVDYTIIFCGTRAQARIVDQMFAKLAES